MLDSDVDQGFRTAIRTPADPPKIGGRGRFSLEMNVVLDSKEVFWTGFAPACPRFLAGNKQPERTCQSCAQVLRLGDH
jgi:hypothetical protein